MIDTEAILYYADHPVEYVQDLIHAEPDRHQKTILRSVADNPMTSVRSGHGIGKSAALSWLIMWFMTTRPFARVPCTAPTYHQLIDILWAELAKWLRTSEYKDELVWTKERLYMNDYSEDWFAVPRTATMPDALQGFHAEHILYIIDEASGVSDKVFEPVLGALSTEGAKLVMMGNPTQLTGFFYNSHHKNRHLYNALHVDSRNSSRVSEAFIQTIIDMYGADSDVFRVRVAGVFPKSQPDSFISMEEALNSSELPELKITLPFRIDIGIDVARYGDDSSVIATVLDKQQQLPSKVYHHNNTMQITGYAVQTIKQMAREHLEAAIYVKVDCDGLGVGVYDRLEELRQSIIDDVEAERKKEGIEASPFILEIYECHFGGKGGIIDDQDPVEFENSTGIMWGSVKRGLHNETLHIEKNEQLITQLSNRKYRINSNGKIELERKEAMKKRGVMSPDRADALALAMYDPMKSDYSITV